MDLGFDDLVDIFLLANEIWIFSKYSDLFWFYKTGILDRVVTFLKKLRK